jgi:patatin-like phospholipase/acyl hydrolase
MILQKELRDADGYKQAEVASNLDYLVQKEWVRKEVEDRAYQSAVGKATYHSEKVTYKISDIGIDHLTGASTYQRSEHLSRINVTNVQGVTVIGDGNVVNTKMTELSGTLSALEDAVVKSAELSDEDRLAVLSDIATIQTQLQKSEPNFGVIATVWSSIENIVTAGEFVTLVAAAAELVHRFVT